MTRSVEESLIALFGSEGRITGRQSVGGGDINVAGLLTLAGGRRVFVKENRAELEGMFGAEAAGLRALADVAESAEAPPVPEALAWGSDGRRAYLILEEIVGGRLNSGEVFGESLAILHREGRYHECGFTGDNWIGSTPQKNTWTGDWIVFFQVHRLGYQWDLARSRGYGDAKTQKAMESVMRRLPGLLPKVDDGNPSLLHGDLWGGNWMAGSDGRAWLIDPAVYYGHREADLAMTQLFGGFPRGFFEAYNTAWPLEPGFADRRDLYNLYHLLNHVNLFGAGYWSGVEGILRRFS